MTITTFDTLKFARQLKDAGVPEAQAEAQANAMSAAFAEALDKQVATKADLLQSEVKIREDISSLKRDNVVFKWMFGLIFAAVIIPLIKSFLG